MLSTFTKIRIIFDDINCQQIDVDVYTSLSNVRRSLYLNEFSRVTSKILTYFFCQNLTNSFILFRFVDVCYFFCNNFSTINFTIWQQLSINNILLTCNYVNGKMTSVSIVFDFFIIVYQIFDCLQFTENQLPINVSIETKFTIRNFVIIIFRFIVIREAKRFTRHLIDFSLFSSKWISQSTSFRVAINRFVIIIDTYRNTQHYQNWLSNYESIDREIIFILKVFSVGQFETIIFRAFKRRHKFILVFDDKFIQSIEDFIILIANVVVVIIEQFVAKSNITSIIFNFNITIVVQNSNIIEFTFRN